MKQQGAVIWLTGLAGSGKSFLAQKLCEELRKDFCCVIYLDGDELRELLGHFGYDKKGRLEVSFKRAKFAKFLSEQGALVVVSAISMFDEVYAFNRENLKNYFEIYVKCDFEELKRRDKKALYSRALRGEIGDVVGVDIEYDEPRAHFVLDNSDFGEVESKLEQLLSAFKAFLGA